MAYKTTVGLEVHVELNTKSKMFCSCRNNPCAVAPNSEICPICTGHPGTLPAANEQAIKKVIKTGLALNCKIAEDSKFDRKNYFYPDLPKGYQISQYDQPLCLGGFLEIPQDKSQIPNPKSQKNSNDQSLNFKKIRIRRIHLEEDTGSLMHPEGADYSLVNLNRAGVPLMELVTEPDITSGKEARLFAEELQRILRYLGVSSADMEKGQMRVEVNISLLPVKSQISSAKSQINPKSQIQNSKLGTKVEIKNLNSFKVVEKAIEYEIKRQTEVLEAGDKVVQETRGWHDKNEITFSQRQKEEAHDYRYFPEPDLPPMHFSKEYIEDIKSTLPELPERRRQRFKKEYGLENEAIEIFVNNKDLGEYYEKVVSEFDAWLEAEDRVIKPDKSPKGHFDPLRQGSGEASGPATISPKASLGGKLAKLVANYLISDVKGLLLGKEFVEAEFKITPENFAEFVKMIYKGEISSKIAKMLVVNMFNTGSDPSDIVEENNWRQMSDDSELEKIIKEVISKNPKPVEDYKLGKQNALQFLAGQVMAATRGTAKPDKVQELLKKLL